MYRGDKTLDDINWIKNVMELEVTSKVLASINAALDKLNENSDLKDVKKVLFAILEELFTRKNETPANK